MASTQAIIKDAVKLRRSGRRWEAFAHTHGQCLVLVKPTDTWTLATCVVPHKSHKYGMIAV